MPAILLFICPIFGKKDLQQGDTRSHGVEQYWGKGRLVRSIVATYGICRNWILSIGNSSERARALRVCLAQFRETDF